MIKAKYYNEYIETREPLKKKKSFRFKNRIHFLGYLDGIYNEEEYKRYIPKRFSFVLKMPLSSTGLINNYMAGIHKIELEVPDIIHLYRCML